MEDDIEVEGATSNTIISLAGLSWSVIKKQDASRTRIKQLLNLHGLWTI